ncbi:aspartyl-phosphate phosphatase Spo0E family protein [Cohnella hashimotonis]|uniref:Aspartyl-phosphate phosphatase Spo0E family protein n=1 Tax=Cohnella hashimotonis TaxID=2826895 RepID=A0ABT6TSG3_9BACL|nr:aspartyl-phosphate phosphatase Spo0E family protein [Cohnella hashimotonis]MDI4649270.1 aspartyl-phosphate phosphatase Spo0E family protein [Cohnella hashimotonis]
MDPHPLIYRLELLQRRLCEMASQLDKLTDPEIVAVSEEADRLIVQLQRMHMEGQSLKKIEAKSDGEPPPSLS